MAYSDRAWHNGPPPNSTYGGYNNYTGRPNSHDGRPSGYSGGGHGGYMNQWPGDQQQNYHGNANGQQGGGSGYLDQWGSGRQQNHNYGYDTGYQNGPPQGGNYGAPPPPPRPRPNSYHGPQPPPGPPPGYYQNQPQGPPNQNLHPNFASNYGPPPPQGSHIPSFPSELAVWSKTDMSSLEDYFCLAPSPEQPILFSAKRPSASGKIVLRVGQPKDKGQEIVRVEKSGDFSSSTVAKFPGGGAPINIQKKARGHNFSMMVNGQMQSFEWRQEGGSGGGGGTLSSLLGGGSKSKSGPFILTRDGDSRPIAEFGVENSSNPLSSKRMIGFFQFVGDAARGGLGPAFSAAAIAIVLQIHNKTLEEKDTKVAMKMFSGLSG